MKERVSDPFQDTGHSWSKPHAPLLPSGMLQVEGAVKFDITEGVLSMFACTNRTNGIDSPKPVNVGSLYKGIKVGWGWGGGKAVGRGVLANFEPLACILKRKAQRIFFSGVFRSPSL